MSEQPTPWMLTTNGRKFPLIDPAPSDVDFRDIAMQLARINRFNGATAGAPYSVAQHCVLVTEILFCAASGGRFSASALVWDRTQAELLLYGLLHDAHEAYIGDQISPVFRAIDAIMPKAAMTWCRLAAGIDRAVFAAAGLEPGMPAALYNAVRQADLIALATERRDVMPDGPWDVPLPAPHSTRIVPEPWHIAAERWESWFRRLHSIVAPEGMVA